MRLRQIGRIIRYNIKMKVRSKGDIIIDNTAVIPKSTIIRVSGDGKIIIGKNVEFRENIILNATNGGVIEIKDNVFLNDYVCLNARKKILIGAGTQIGQGVKMYDHDHEYMFDDFKHKFLVDPINVGCNTWIGADVIVLRGSDIGKRCVIGASSLVKGNVDDYTIFYNERSKKEIKGIINQG